MQCMRDEGARERTTETEYEDDLQAEWQTECKSSCWSDGYAVEYVQYNMNFIGEPKRRSYHEDIRFFPLCTTCILSSLLGAHRHQACACVWYALQQWMWWRFLLSEKKKKSCIVWRDEIKMVFYIPHIFIELHLMRAKPVEHLTLQKTHISNPYVLFGCMVKCGECWQELSKAVVVLCIYKSTFW